MKSNKAKLRKIWNRREKSNKWKWRSISERNEWKISKCKIKMK